MASSDTPSFERPAEWWTSERRPGGGGERADIGTATGRTSERWATGGFARVLFLAGNKYSKNFSRI